MILEKIPVGPMQANCYVLAEKENSSALIIDPAGEEKKIFGALKKHKLIPKLVINTHGHFDHILADDAFGVSVCIHRLDAKMLTNPELNLSSFFSTPFRVKSKIEILEDNQKIREGNLVLKVLHTPGHTPGGICLLLLSPQNNILFSGDTLFYNGVGRYDFPQASKEELFLSIKEKLFSLSNETLVYPGHGPQTTIEEEKQNNPFLNE